MKNYTLIAESNYGAFIIEKVVSAESEQEARLKFWKHMTEGERNACTFIECVNEVAAQ